MKDLRNSFYKKRKAARAVFPKIKKGGSYVLFCNNSLLQYILYHLTKFMGEYSVKKCLTVCEYAQ